MLEGLLPFPELPSAQALSIVSTGRNAPNRVQAASTTPTPFQRALGACMAQDGELHLVTLSLLRVGESTAQALQLRLVRVSLAGASAQRCLHGRLE